MTTPLLTADLPGVGGHIKARPGDFFVQELPAVEPSGEGEHVLFEIRKTGLTTDEAVRRIARALRISPRDVGFAGLKDKHAVTQQVLSARGTTEANVMQLQAPDLGVLWAARHSRKLKRGASRGNRFAVKIRGADPLGVVKLRPILAVLKGRGVPNFFGPQRFGRSGDNVARGLALLRGEADVPPRRRSILLSSVQSAVFNEVLARRLDTLGEVSAGDVAYKHENGACFVVEDEAAERPRAQSFEISPTGPLPGPKLLAAREAQGELEAEVMREQGVANEDFAQFRGFSGERRPLRVVLADAQLAAGVDEYGPHVTAAFSLPPGSYATVVLRELMKVDDLDAPPELRDTPPIGGLAARPGTPDGKI